MGQTKKTDNDHRYFLDKVMLRNDTLPKGPVHVLDCFAGEGRLWKEVIRRNPQKEIKILPIEKEKDKGGFHLVGDNLR